VEQDGKVKLFSIGKISPYRVTDDHHKSKKISRGYYLDLELYLFDQKVEVLEVL
jgi:hypothetical protein